MPSINQQIDTILSITFRFEELCEKEQWDELSVALEQRQTNLEALFKQEIPEKDRAAILEAIQKIQTLDSNYESKLTHIKNSVKNELFNFKKKNNAAKSYAAISQNS